MGRLTAGLAQSQADGDFTGVRPWRYADLAQALDEFEKGVFFRQRGLANSGLRLPKNHGRQCGGAPRSHGPGGRPEAIGEVHISRSCFHRVVGRVSLRSAPDQRVRRLKRCYRGPFFGAESVASKLKRDPTNFSFFLQGVQALPRVFKTGDRCRPAANGLVKDRIAVDMQAAKAVLAFARIEAALSPF